MTTITTTDVSVGQVTDPSVINNNFGNVKATVNGAIDNSNVAAGAAIAVSKLAAGTDDQLLKTVAGVPTWSDASGGGGAVPSGVVAPYAGSAAPTDWLLCDGTAVSRATYAALFTAIGTAYGSGDGSTTFNVPDMRGRVGVGKGSNTSVDALGENEGVTEANRRPQHRHTAHSHTSAVQFDGAGAAGSSARAFSGGSLSTTSVDGGSGTATDSLNAPAYLVFNFIIKT